MQPGRIYREAQRGRADKETVTTEEIIRNQNYRGRSREPQTRINHRIRVSEIRCIDENGEAMGIVRTGDALRRANEFGMDLVEVSPNAKPPVCRIMDYGKYKYDQEK